MIEKEFNYWVVWCDNCETPIEQEFLTYKEALDSSKEEGWRSTRIDGNWANLCPECQEMR